MLPEVQIVKHDLAAGCSPRHETSASASCHLQTLSLCKIGNQYTVTEGLGGIPGGPPRSLASYASLW